MSERASIVSNMRPVAAIHPPLQDGEIVHLRLAPTRDDLELGRLVDVVLLCEQFGAVWDGPVRTVLQDGVQYVNCRQCLEAMHA